MTFDGRTATTATMFAIFVAACLLSLGLPGKAAFMPLLIGVPGSLLCGAQLIIDLRRTAAPTRDQETDQVKEPSEDGSSELVVFAWLALFFGALLSFGFSVGAPLVVIAHVRFSSRETWLNAAVAGVGTFAVMYGIFVWLLELTLFPGLVLEWLF